MSWTRLHLLVVPSKQLTAYVVDVALAFSITAVPRYRPGDA